MEKGLFSNFFVLKIRRAARLAKIYSLFVKTTLRFCHVSLSIFQSGRPFNLEVPKKCLAEPASPKKKAPSMGASRDFDHGIDWSAVEPAQARIWVESDQAQKLCLHRHLL